MTKRAFYLTTKNEWRNLSPRMDPAMDRLGNLLGEAECLLPRYLEATAGLAHEKKGIRRSELFFFFAFAAPKNPARIVESGRARAQSTLVLSRLFPETSSLAEFGPDFTRCEMAAERLRESAMWIVASAIHFFFCPSWSRQATSF